MQGGISDKDKVLDIGCGDGRALLMAASRGARAVGYEINDNRAREAEEKIREAGVHKLAKVYALNAIEVIDTALADGVTFVFMYLTPRGLRKILKYLRANPRPLRVVSYMNPIHEGSQFRAGPMVPYDQKLWCESDKAAEREKGVKFPLYCYRFNFPNQDQGQ